MKLLWITLILSLSVFADANYLLHSFDSAIFWRDYYHDEANSFRTRLTSEADDFGYYFTRRMRYAIAQATTEQQGAALQICAANCADACNASITRFDDTLRVTQTEGDNVHMTVYHQLMETNIKAEDLELFYYYHSHRMLAARERYYDYLLLEMADRWAEMWWAYFVIGDALDACIDAALN